MPCRLTDCSCVLRSVDIEERKECENYIAPVSKYYRGEPRPRIKKTVINTPSSKKKRIEEDERKKK